jgi:hypothetical protein
MTSNSITNFQLAGAYRLLAAFMAIVALTGCAPDFRNLGPCAVCFGPPTQVSLEGTLSGLIDATSGALSPIGGSPFMTGTQPSAIAISD